MATKEEKEKLKEFLPEASEHKHIANAKRLRQKVFNPMGRVEDINPDEILIADVRRHPIGLFFIYVQVIFALSLSFFLIFTLVPSASESSGVGEETGNLASVIFGMFAVFLALIFLIIMTRIYKANQLIVTNDNVTQVTQVGLFHRKVSEVSMENIEDVSAHQEGILSTLFGYGRLHIETAGEQDNYNFKFCPNPNAYTKAIQDARVEFLKTHH